MKKILFTMCVLLGSITFSMAQEDSYKIEGHLGNAINGQIALVAETEQGIVELGIATITNGDFEFKGRMPELTVVHLMTSNKQNVLETIMLENGHYTVTSGSNGFNVEGGGEAQAIWKEFSELNKYLMQSKQQAEAQTKTVRSQMEFQALQQSFERIVLQVRTEEINLLKKHGNSPASAYVVANGMKQGTTAAKLTERYALLGEKAKATIYGKQIANELAKMEQVAVGSIAPDFSAPLSDGGVLSLHETKAKVKIVDFWASWCGPCRNENVNLVKLYKRFRPRGLEIIAVSIDDNKHAWLGAIGQDGSTWKNVSDLKGQQSPIAAQYYVRGIPCTYILDEENRIVAKDLRGKELEKKVEEMLKKK